MSRRRIEAGVNAGSNFSLRSMADSTQVSATTMPVSTTSRRVIATPTIFPTSGLSFKFNGPAVAASGTSVVPTTKSSVTPLMIANPFISSQTSPTLATPDVMRLTASADDLRQRLKLATEKVHQLENQIHRSHTQIQKERQDSQLQINAVRQEAASVRDSELKLRTELASRPSVTEFKQNKFDVAVRTAIEAEEMTARVADSEARLTSLNKRFESLNAEVVLLESARAKAIEATAASSQAVFNEEQLAEKVSALAAAEIKLSEASARLGVLSDDIAEHEALRDSHRADANQAELELVTANEALVAAVTDLTATKEEQAELVAQLSERKRELEELEESIQATEALPEAPPPAIMKITGAMHPGTEIGVPIDSITRRIDAMGCSGCGIPFHFTTDAPLTIGAALTSNDAQPVDAMVQAIIGDLKEYFKASVVENAKRGVSPSGAAAVTG